MDPELQAAVKEVRDYFWAEFKKLPGREAGPSYVTWKSFVAEEAKVVKQYGAKELKRRTDNCLHSGYNSNPTYKGFIMDPDRWVELMQKREQGSKDDFTNKRGRTDTLGAFGKQALSGMADHFAMREEHYHEFTFPLGGDIYQCKGGSCTQRRRKNELSPKDLATVNSMEQK